MSKVLVIFSHNWADEFDVYGFSVYDKDKWESLLKSFKEYEDFNGFYFGTNEGWEKEEKNDIISGYKVIDITDEDEKILHKLFYKQYRDKITFGNFPAPEDIIETEEIEEE